MLFTVQTDEENLDSQTNKKLGCPEGHPSFNSIIRLNYWLVGPLEEVPSDVCTNRCRINALESLVVCSNRWVCVQR